MRNSMDAVGTGVVQLRSIPIVPSDGLNFSTEPSSAEFAFAENSRAKYVDFR